MRYPEPLREKGVIGVCSPSFGVSSSPYEERYAAAKKHFEKLGYTVKETASVFGITKARSTDAKTRAMEFENLWMDEEVDFIFSVAGGEFMMEILPYVDFEKLKQAKPKYFVGYSDNTNLTFTLTTIADICSIYSYHIGEYCPSRWGDSLKETYEVLRGRRDTVVSKKYTEKPWQKHEPDEALKNFRCHTKNTWKILNGEEVHVSGRLIGGCLDCLITLCGTPYDNVKEFTERYREDGIIWYLECYDLNIFDQGRALWQLKQAGWFSRCKAVLLGRPMQRDTLFGITYEENLHDFLDDLQVPVVYDIDVGHVPPSVPMKNGTVAEVTVKDGAGTIRMIEK
ncbi:MAG: LD-carboxypeptidase [Erysipelotrichaceae bacterium]|nr:LD-carboxypeptidase [Erysipelotrichaceae bacterium]